MYIYKYIFVLFCEIAVFVGSFRWSQSRSPLPSSTVMTHGPGPEVVGRKKKVVGICIILHLGVDVYFGSILQWQIEVYVIYVGIS